MTGYQKSISYLDYLENGMKIRNAGFVRAEENNGQMRLEVRMKNLPDMFSGQFELHADCGGVVGKISLNRGSGSCCIVWDHPAKDGRQMVEAGGVYLRLPGRRLVQTVWTTPIRLLVEPEDGIKGIPEAETGVKGQPEPESGVKEQPELETGVKECLEPEDSKSSQIKSGENVQPAQPAEIRSGQMQQEEFHSAADLEKQPEQEHFYGDKWEQLTHMYPMVHPFGDERAYLSIAPKDFVVLCREYQKMVHNSFLLHGFYNYHHLLLGKIQNRDEWQYYLGVPGNFYTREKMVAEMFGFEAFEGEKNPASPGDFGYYMKQVDI